MTEDERHEQLLHELTQMQAQVNCRTDEIAQRLQGVERRVKRAEWTVDALWLMFLIGLATYVVSKLVDETWSILAIAGVLIFSLVGQEWWRRAAEGQRSANGDRGPAPNLDPRIGRLRR